MFVRFIIVLMCVVITSAFGVEASHDSFKKNIEQLLDGKSHREFIAENTEDLLVTIKKERKNKKSVYEVSFTAVGLDGGAFMEIFPTPDGYYGYLEWLHKIHGKYSGTQLLHAMDTFCQKMQLKKVILIDASQYEEEEESESSYSLKNYHILTSNKRVGWYESKGFRPVFKHSALALLAWQSKKPLESFYTTTPVTKGCYRHAVRAFATMPVTKYLTVVKALGARVSGLTTHAVRLESILKQLPELDQDCSFSDLISALGEIDSQLQGECMKELESEQDMEAFLRHFVSRKEISPSIAYATLLCGQTYLRYCYNAKPKEERNKFLKEICRNLKREKLFATIDIHLLMDNGSAESREHLTAILEKTGLDPSKRHYIKTLVKKLQGQNLRQFLKEICFGAPSRKQFEHISKWMDSMLQSDDPDAFYLGYVMTQLIIEQAIYFEKNY